MKNLMKKAGYVSIEVVIVAAIILLVGLVAVTAFATKGNDASNQAMDAIDTALDTTFVEA